MKYIIRNYSVITGNKNLEHLYTFKDFPVFIGATDQDIKKDLIADLSISICKESGIIQLDKILPPEVVYSGYHSEALGSIWDRHHKEFLEFLKKYNLKNVLEIGGGNGRMALDYIKGKTDIRWSIVEPNPVNIDNDQIEYIPVLFDDKFTFDKKIDAIVHSHAFEHMYFPKAFLEKVTSLLKANQYHIFTLPNLFAYLDNKFTNVLNFEHTIFITEYFIDYLLSNNGFEILEKKYFDKHSIFYATKKVDYQVSFNFESQYDKYKKMFLDYLEFNTKIINNYNKQIKSFNGKVFLFGAHVFSQYLLNQGIDKTKIEGILDNSKIKQGKRLYGSSLIIFSPEILKDKKNVAVILRAGVYQDEIRKQISSINPLVAIWE
jgi:hypothetical protein